MTQTENAKSTRYWRSINELENTPEFEEMLHREFPQAASEFPKGISRRRWLQLMGASLALGAAGCRFEEEIIAPFVQRPANRIPGQTQQYATTVEIAGKAEPLLITSYDGRPIKVDGNKDHPLSVGASSQYAQACILDLYDPDRSRNPVFREGDRVSSRTMDEFRTFFRDTMRQHRADQGKGLCILAEPTNSPTQRRLRIDLLAALPEAKWFDYGAVTDEYRAAGARQAFGRDVQPLYQLENAKVIVSLDADPLHDDAASIRNSRGWAQSRDVDDESVHEINRLYCIESRFTTTGMAADHRLPLRSDQIYGFLASLVDAVRAREGEADGGTVSSGDPKEKFLEALAQDLVTHPGECAIFVGRNQPPEVHAMAFALNESLIPDSVADEDRPVVYIDEPFERSPDSQSTIREFVELAGNNAIDTLVMIGGNPYYDVPMQSGLQEVLLPTKITNRIQLSSYINETSLVSSWHVPQLHPFEGWGDAVMLDGSWGVAQPMIEPLFGGLSAIDLLALMLDDEPTDAMTLVRETAETYQIGAGNDAAWNQVVHDGFVADSIATPVSVSVVEQPEYTGSMTWMSKSASDNMKNGELEVVLVVGSSLHDGRFANNAWLQECPDPVTKVTWGNAACVGPATAKALGLEQNQIAKISANGHEIEIPVFIQPGQAPGSIHIALGYGRTMAGHVGGNQAEGVDIVGIDVGELRTMNSLYHCANATVTPTSQSFELGTTQDHFAIDEVGLREISNRMGRLVKEGEYTDFVKFRHELEHPHDENEDESHHEDDGHHEPHWPPAHLHFPNVDLNPGPKYTTENKWGMSIDLNKCTGCHACMIACQSENNIPVVGLEQVRRGREMHWLRIDRYFGGDDRENPKVVTQPVTCHHCEKAPCETVCPVAATTHSREGLNDMVYNRCVGTRYCANNCPYKVRRFNYLNFTEAVTFIKYPWADKLSKANQQLRGLVMNPEVTVRSRGVMEKCTYCVQRIQNAKINARNEFARDERPEPKVHANEVTTACQDACPTNAILFGDLNLEGSDVKTAHEGLRSYAMLEELNIIPRTKYLARVRNSHPALKSTEEKEDAAH